MTILLVVIAFIVIAELSVMIALQATSESSTAKVIINNGGGDFSAVEGTEGEDGTDDALTDLFPSGPTLQGENICAATNPNLPDTECILNAMVNVGPQAGANVTKGYKGDLEVDHVPITTPYFQNGMCPVNVHWHLGSEHYSVGEFDENGDGPNGGAFGPQGIDGGAQPGYRCSYYNAQDPKFTTEYEWKHCINMLVGETYEVHWPHSAAGACGTPNQYQTPFYDGVFCNLSKLDLTTPGATAQQIGVQAQVFTIVNDDSYYYPDLIRGMIVDGDDYGSDIHYYTGSTTGSGRNNAICSSYSPITWQVDRKCHLISASAFDKLCYDMKQQRYV